MEQAQKGQSTTNLYPANTREVGLRLRGFRGAWFSGGGKRGSIFGFLPWLLLGICLVGMVSYPKEVINGWDHLMHAIELGSEVEIYDRNK